MKCRNSAFLVLATTVLIGYSLFIQTLRYGLGYVVKPRRLFLSPSHRSIQVSLKSSNLSEDELCTTLLYNESQSFTYSRHPELTTDAEVLEAINGSCGFLTQQYFFLLNPNNFNEEEKNTSIAYSIIVHTKVNQLLHYLSAIYAPQNIYCIHIDLKASDDFFNTLKKVEECLPNVILSSKREYVVYKTFSRLQAEFNCMKDLLNVSTKKYNWTYVVNTCGQDFPLYTNFEMVRQLNELKGHSWIGRQDDVDKENQDRMKYVHGITTFTNNNNKKEKKIIRYNKLKAPTPFGIPLRKSSAYNVFSRRFLHWALLESDKARALRHWFQDTDSPEEHYWAMLDGLKETPGRTGGHWGSMSPYLVWYRSKCKGYWRHFNCVFDFHALPDIIRSPKQFFANKFDITYDSLPLTCLRKWLNERRMKRNDIRNPDKQPIIFFK